jgi:hypothetical protein
MKFILLKINAVCAMSAVFLYNSRSAQTVMAKRKGTFTCKLFKLAFRLNNLLHLDAIIPFGVSQTSNAGLP